MESLPIVLIQLWLCDWNWGNPWSLPSASYSDSNHLWHKLDTRNFEENDIKVTFGNVACQIDSFDAAVSPAILSAICSNPEAGDFTPRVHLMVLVMLQLVQVFLKSQFLYLFPDVSPTEVNPNGGTIWLLVDQASHYPVKPQIPVGISVRLIQLLCTITAVTHDTIE